MDAHSPSPPPPPEQAKPPTPPVPPAEPKSSGPLTRWVVGKLYPVASAVGWILLGGASLAQANLIVQQLIDERKEAPRLSAMRSEQAWLNGHGLAPFRTITVPSNDQTGASVGVQPALAGRWRPGRLLDQFDALSQKAGFALLTREPIIFSSRTQNRDITALSPEDAYRHEEGHARALSLTSGLGAPAAWPKAAAELIARRMTQARLIRDRKTQPVADADALNWRDRWLLAARSEAFADAFACLSKARAGENAYRESALSSHALRVFGDFRQGDDPASGNIVSALAVAGEEHAVDMASFLAGQFDPAQVARLDSAGIDQLANQLADASVAWALARHGALTGFFSEPGRAWWETRVAQGKSKEDSKLWASLKSASLGHESKASFGSFEFHAGGQTFKAMGLPSSPSKFGAAWRFDGFGGIVGWAPFIELGADGPVDRGLMAVLLGGAEKDPRLKPVYQLKNSMNDGADGALWTHWALAWRMGADISAEASRAQTQIGPFAPKGQARALFQSWSKLAREMGVEPGRRPLVAEASSAATHATSQRASLAPKR